MNQLCCLVNPTEQCYYCHGRVCDFHFRLRHNDLQTISIANDPCIIGIKSKEVSLDGHYLVGIGCNLYDFKNPPHIKHYG